MRISVILPHLNQPEHLKNSLQALHSQVGAPEDVEFIVVDNGSARMPEEICARWPDTRLLRETTPGPGPARNHGIEQANGDILAFIDADCMAHPDWLLSIWTAFTDEDTNVIGGDVQVPIDDLNNPTALECYERIYAYRNKQYIASGYSGTGNLAMRRGAYEKVGPFAGIGVAEDRDWGLRAGAVGIATHWTPDMIVYHPARTTFLQMKQKWDRHIAHDFSAVKGLSKRARWILRAVAIGLSPLGEVFRIIRSDRISGFRQRLLAFQCLTRIRIYRFWRMMSLAFRADGHALSGAWNRENK